MTDRGYFGDASRQTFSARRAVRRLYRTTRSSYGASATACSRSAVRVVFENNQERRWQWDGRDRWKTFEVDRPVRAVTAEVDPERVLLAGAH